MKEWFIMITKIMHKAKQLISISDKHKKGILIRNDEKAFSTAMTIMVLLSLIISAYLQQVNFSRLKLIRIIHALAMIILLVDRKATSTRIYIILLLSIISTGIVLYW